ncbi:MAG: glucose-6-phosphate isomerase [Legionellales bacterium RIFCSPHIGHO2_12_FULL_42_9]|nr:MAG: glucose-6-phosphate isomerase [Legionellales bacterium RIFCSPHIGHO2_12_FULL_42_9]
MSLTKREAWKKIETHAEAIKKFTLPPTENRVVLFDNLTLDYSAQRLDPTALALLCELADECALREKINALMTGHPVNQSEQRPALHTALRVFSEEPICVNNTDVVQDVLAVREQMRMIAEQIRAGAWLGFSGKRITDIVNIGIGGSQLGPQFCLDALSELTTNTLQFHFISEIDVNAFSKVVVNLNPETTLFIVSSKSFTTQETLFNAKKALAWIGQHENSDNHFIAVTAFPNRAKEIGINQVLPIWDWVGGRYSVCSAINLITCIAIGFDNFCAFLEGANSMDEHFRLAPFAQNLPVLLALLGIWNNNVLKIHLLLLLSYAEVLKLLVPYIQQLDMESNGKSIDNEGRAVNYSTGPIVWGGLGNQAQHSYYQLLCQGTHLIAADLISVDSFNNDAINHLCSAHREVLSKGTMEETDPNNFVPGNIPINHIRLADCSPKTLGALIAMYEHKVFVQGVIWNINSFDQPGVESSKKIMRKVCVAEQVVMP